MTHSSASENGALPLAVFLGKSHLGAPSPFVVSAVPTMEHTGPAWNLPTGCPKATLSAVNPLHIQRGLNNA